MNTLLRGVKLMNWFKNQFKHTEFSFNSFNTVLYYRDEENIILISFGFSFLTFTFFLFSFTLHLCHFFFLTLSSICKILGYYDQNLLGDTDIV